MVALFRVIAEEFVQAYGQDLKATVVSYFLSSPYRNSSGFTIAGLRESLKLEFPYTKLLFIRFTTTLYERLDPMPVEWDDIKWLFDAARTPWEMTRVVDACFELIDHASTLFSARTAEPTVNAFLRRVRNEQELLYGRSFWDEVTATHRVYEYFKKFADLDNARIDLPSHLCWMAQEEHELGEPGLDEWEALVKDALAEGYVILAQALTAYKVIEEVLLLDRITDWQALMRLNLILKHEPHYELLTRAVQFSAQVWEQRGRQLFSWRLAGQAPSEFRAKKERVIHVMEGAARPATLEEVKVRLVEHVGRRNWDRLTEVAKNWLLEGDMNWSDFNFRDWKSHARTDWSFPSNLWFKAIEHELVLRYGPLCREAGDCSKGQDKDVSIGNVVYFLSKASKNDEERSRILHRSNVPPVPDTVRKNLNRLCAKYRNPGAHPKPFDQGLLSELRWELFGEGALRDILECLAPDNK